MSLIALALFAAGAKGSRLKGRSVTEIIVRDGTWAFMLIFGESLVHLKFAAFRLLTLATTVFMVLAIISNVLPASLSRAAALYRYVGYRKWLNVLVCSHSILSWGQSVFSFTAS